MRTNRLTRLHYQHGVLGIVTHVVSWARRYQYLTNTIERIIILVVTAAFLALDHSHLSPPLTIAILSAALIARGLWAAAMDGAQSCLRTMLDAVFVGLTIASLVVLFGKSYPQQEIVRFGGQLVYICIFIVFLSQIYAGILVDMAMTTETEWQRGHHVRQSVVAKIRGFFRG